ncbi:BQ2448_1894 [Microbotryum intermedium]|uniref:BQ2448_1894 protein n=1 Tax=Microbotryum intermedium TaxID=269621 RepID=A0A238F9I8_9BASI|nr:BQ2448_1894 [Microbotryum intermedium]
MRLSTFQFGGVVGYRDGRAIGTSPLRDGLYQRPDIPLLGNSLYALKNSDLHRDLRRGVFFGCRKTHHHHYARRTHDRVEPAKFHQRLDLMSLFFRFTLNSFSDMAFGSAVNALSTETDGPVPFAMAFDEAQGIMNDRFINPFWRVTELFNGTMWRMRKAVKIIDDFSYKPIDERTKTGLNDVKPGEKRSKSETALLSLYMSIRNDQGKPLSRKQLRDAVLKLIIAGRDTIAQACSWSMYHVIRHPEIVKNIRAEVDEMGTIEYDSYKTMMQTNAAFNEALRLHPSVPKNLWQALGDDQIPNGPFIKADDFVEWSDHSINRNESVWGPDAKVFNPARWIDEVDELKKESQWKYHVWNGGSRLCLGQDLARYESAALLATILGDFEFEFAPAYSKVQMMPNEDVPQYASSLTLPTLEPLMVVATPRKRCAL